MNVVIDSVLWLPTTLQRWVQAYILPRWLFVLSYKPASASERVRSKVQRNHARLLDYKIKRTLHRKMLDE